MVIDKAARSAGIQRPYATSKDGRPMNIVSPHTLRHLHAVTALDSGVPLNDLQAQLGHTDLEDDLDLSESGHQPSSKELRGFQNLKAGNYFCCNRPIPYEEGHRGMR